MFKTPNLQIQICTGIISAVDWKQNSTSMELKTESESYKTTNICLSKLQSISLVPYSKL